MLKTTLWRWLIVLQLCAASGCATSRTATSNCLGEPCSKPILIVVDGAGDFRVTSIAVRRVVTTAGFPFCVQTFVWSHGYARVLADQVDYEHAREQGQRLADELLAQRASCPTTPIYLLGSSAGVAVVLAALEVLPSCIVDQAILLCPAVSSCYDLRPALRRVRGPIDIFYSSHDLAYLGVGTRIYGTSDRSWQPPAGRVGFRRTGHNPEDFVLYSRLRQHPWTPDVAWTGNKGGHYGSYADLHLQTYVLPLLGNPDYCAGPPLP